jgi:hypothetical protein
MSMMWVALVIALGMLVVYVAYPARCRSTATKEEASLPQPGDDLVSASRGGYTLAVSIDAVPSKSWPWLVQMDPGARVSSFDCDHRLRIMDAADDGHGRRVGPYSGPAPPHSKRTACTSQ